MHCSYCFYSNVTEIRTVKNHGIMSDGVLETIVRKALAEADRFCVFGFQGGEPTLAGLDFYRKLIEYVKAHNVNDVSVSYSLQTNGLLLDDEWVEFFRENKFLIGLSIDASKQVHDDFRTDMSGKGTHNRCMKAARLLSKKNVDFNILSVLTRQLASHPDRAYRFYKQNGFRYIQFIPCLDGLGEKHGSNFYSLDIETYTRFLCRIFDLWYTDLINNEYYSIRAFDNYVQMLAGKPAENCAMNGICNTYALIEADGSVYPCDFYALDEYLLGNINTHGFEQMLTSEKSEAFISSSHYIDHKCRSCEYHFICRGGCRRDREPVINGIPSLNHYCNAYKIFFDHALQRMKVLAQRMMQ